MYQIIEINEEVKKILGLYEEYVNSVNPAGTNNLLNKEALYHENVYCAGAYDNNKLAGIGAVRIVEADVKYGELMGIFISSEQRSKGMGTLLLLHLEQFLKQQDVRVSRLETSVYLQEAIAFYSKLKYNQREPFGNYQAEKYSYFMEKQL